MKNSIQNKMKQEIFTSVANENPGSIKRLKVVFENFKTLSPAQQEIVLETFEGVLLDTTTAKDGSDPKIKSFLDELAGIFRSEMKR